MHLMQGGCQLWKQILQDTKQRNVVSCVFFFFFPQAWSATAWPKLPSTSCVRVWVRRTVGCRQDLLLWPYYREYLTASAKMLWCTLLWCWPAALQWHRVSHGVMVGTQVGALKECSTENLYFFFWTSKSNLLWIRNGFAKFTAHTAEISMKTYRSHARTWVTLCFTMWGKCPLIWHFKLQA